MFTYLRTVIREKWPLFLVVIGILSVVGLGYMGALSVTDRMVIQAKSDLEKNWRYQYDILVLPKSSDGIQGLEDGWIAPQASISNYGGISMEDLETIRSIAGVQVAAPLSFIGYVENDQIDVRLSTDQEGQYSFIESKATSFNGLTDITIYDYTTINEYSTNYGGGPLDWDPANYDALSNKLSEERDGWKSFMPAGSSLRQPNYLSLIAIDPVAENELYSFNESLTAGNSLEEASVKTDGGIRVLPVVVLDNEQAEMKESIKISRILVPETIVERDLEQGATAYLTSLPREELVNLTIDSLSKEWKYKRVNLSLLKGDEYRESTYAWSGSTENYLYRFSPIQFSVMEVENNGIPLMKAEKVDRINPYDDRMISLYRKDEGYETYNFALDIIDLYDATKIVPQFKGTWTEGDPVDIYTPHHSKIIADGARQSISPTPLYPLPYKDTYYTGSPDAITSLSAAYTFYKADQLISSIRVVVEGVEERSEASQLKVEKVAKEIMDKTGHQVDIMLGSTASKVHIDLDTNNPLEPGVVEEGWQQVGVSWSIQEKIEKSNILLFIYLLVVGFVFCYTVITHSLLRRSSEFAMLRSIGWSRMRIIQSLLLEAITLSVLSLIPIMIANEQTGILSGKQFVFVWIIVFPVIGIGYLTGSLKALKLSPRAGLEGEGTDWKFMRLFSIKGLLSYIVHQLMRRPMRFGLLSTVIALTSFMVILFIGTQQSLSDFLLLSFLGETIDLHLKGLQTAFLIAGIVLTVSIVFLLLYLNINERKGEFFVLRSIGWSLKRIKLYIGMEVVIVAIIGSILGSLGAYAILTYFSTLWFSLWLLIMMIGFPPIIMLIFSIIIVGTLKMKRIVNHHYA